MKNITVQFKEWTGSSNGEHRYYIQNLPELIGLEVEYYKTGNISYSTLDGEPLSHARAGELLDVNAYLDAEGNVIVNTYGRTPRALSLNEIKQRITDRLAAGVTVSMTGGAL